MPISNALQLRRTGNPAMLRGRVWLRRHRLDELLAEGASPGDSPELERRAAQLASPRCRRGLAVSLERVLEAAEEPSSGLTARAPLQRREILAARSVIRELADELRHADHVNARGVAMVERLLTDGSSPLYGPPTSERLEDSLEHILAALLLV